MSQCPGSARPEGTPAMEFFCVCFAATLLAHQLHQKRIQVVCSNKAARKRLAQRHLRKSCHMFVSIVVCACSRHALDFQMLFATLIFGPALLNTRENIFRKFRKDIFNCMVPSDWDLAPKCVCGSQSHILFNLRVFIKE